MWGAQWNWALAGCERSAAYWRNLFEAMTEANSRIARCMQEGASAAGPLPFSGELPATGFQAVDSAYREMISLRSSSCNPLLKAFAPAAAAAQEDVKKAA